MPTYLEHLRRPSDGLAHVSALQTTLPSPVPRGMRTFLVLTGNMYLSWACALMMFWKRPHEGIEHCCGNGRLVVRRPLLGSTKAPTNSETSRSVPLCRSSYLSVFQTWCRRPASFALQRTASMTPSLGTITQRAGSWPMETLPELPSTTHERCRLILGTSSCRCDKGLNDACLTFIHLALPRLYEDRHVPLIKYL